MKTAMQILISELEEGLEQDEIKVSPKELLQNLIWRCEGLLEKEKEQMCEFADEFSRECIDFHHAQTMSPDRFFELTFKAKER